MSRSRSLERSTPTPNFFGRIVPGREHKIGAGFEAVHFNEDMFGGLMDPLLMVDHFVMTGSTFEPHLHAGISAVTFVFEDTVGNFRNRDTLGNNVLIEPGDLYWLTAAKGAVHDERPATDCARIHALQIFVNLPAAMKGDDAQSFHVRAGDMPKLTGSGYCVRVALGRSGEIEGAAGAPQELTILDGKIEPKGRFRHCLPAGCSAWIYAVSGGLSIEAGNYHCPLSPGFSVIVSGAETATDIILESNVATQFVLIAGFPLCESFVKHGSLVMSSQNAVQRTLDDYAAGRFGAIPN